MRRKRVNEIRCEHIIDNHTWNTCPMCGRSWKDEQSTPTLLHKVTVCKDCWILQQVSGIDNREL